MAADGPLGAPPASGIEWDTCVRRIAQLRRDVERVIAEPESPLADDIRERYGEVVDLARPYSALFDDLRALGAVIRDLEDEGLLPQSLVARAPR